MNVLMFGNPCFKEHLSGIGHNVVTVGVAPGYDMVVPESSFEIDRIMGLLPKNAMPDVCLFVERIGMNHWPTGIEKIPCRRVYYSIDTHLGYSWTSRFGRIFDCVITTQRDYLDALRRELVTVHWLPWGVDPRQFCDRGMTRDLDIVFAGTVEDRPRRRAMLDYLGAYFKIEVLSGRWYPPAEISDYFSRARIVVNEPICGEVNFRVFEAMATGAMLLTENVAQGLSGLFSDGEHLVTFTPENLLSKASYYLANPVERERIAAAGKSEVLSHHTLAERARKLVEILESVPMNPHRCSPRALADFGRSYYLTTRAWQEKNGTALFQAESIMLAARERSQEGEILLNLAEFYASRGMREAARQYYTGSWNSGLRTFRMISQWGLFLLDDSRHAEERGLCRLSEAKRNEARTVLAAVEHLGLPADIIGELMEAINGEIPSATLCYWLGRAAELYDNIGSNRFIPALYDPVPLHAEDFLRIALQLEPTNGRIAQRLGDIYLRNTLYLDAAKFYLQAIENGEVTAKSYMKAAQALLCLFRPQQAYDFACQAVALDHACEASPLYARILEAISSTAPGS